MEAPALLVEDALPPLPPPPEPPPIHECSTSAGRAGAASSGPGSSPGVVSCSSGLSARRRRLPPSFSLGTQPKGSPPAVSVCSSGAAARVDGPEHVLTAATPVAKRQRREKVNAPDAEAGEVIAKPLSAYTYFMRAQREGKTLTTSKWGSLLPDERRPYEVAAAQDKARYEVERMKMVLGAEERPVQANGPRLANEISTAASSSRTALPGEFDERSSQAEVATPLIRRFDTPVLQPSELPVPASGIASDHSGQRAHPMSGSSSLARLPAPAPSSEAPTSHDSGGAAAVSQCAAVASDSKFKTQGLGTRIDLLMWGDSDEEGAGSVGPTSGPAALVSAPPVVPSTRHDSAQVSTPRGSARPAPLQASMDPVTSADALILHRPSHCEPGGGAGASGAAPELPRMPEPGRVSSASTFTATTPLALPSDGRTPTPTPTHPVNVSAAVAPGRGSAFAPANAPPKAAQVVSQPRTDPWSQARQALAGERAAERHGPDSAGRAEARPAVSFFDRLAELE